MTTNTGSRVAVVVSTIMGKVLSILGYGIAILGLLIIITFVTDGDYADLHIFIIVLVIPGVILIILGARIKRRIRRFRTYVSIITGGMDSLDIIAVQTKRAPDFVVSDIQMMINKRYFSNAIIDFVNNRVIMLGRPTPTDMHVPPTPTNYQSVFKNATCSGCGANHIKEQGEVVTCEYCGSPIK